MLGKGLANWYISVAEETFQDILRSLKILKNKQKNTMRDFAVSL